MKDCDIVMDKSEDEKEYGVDFRHEIYRGYIFVWGGGGEGSWSLEKSEGRGAADFSPNFLVQRNFSFLQADLLLAHTLLIRKTFPARYLGHFRPNLSS